MFVIKAECSATLFVLFSLKARPHAVAGEASVVYPLSYPPNVMPYRSYDMKGRLASFTMFLAISLVEAGEVQGIALVYRFCRNGRGGSWDCIT
jgi:hypothetical protein